MKIAKVLLVIVILVTIIIVLPGCQAGTDTTTAPSTQVAAVTKGNLAQEISAAGNLALSHTEDLAVDLFYPTGTKGTIGEVLVEAGDTVTKDQVLVTLDKSEWNDQLAALEDTVTAKERALTQAQINLKTAEQTLKNAHDLVSAKELSVLNATIGLQQAESALAAGIAAVDYNAALSELRAARTWLDYINTTYKSLGKEDFLVTQENAEQRYTIAKTNYDNITAGYDGNELNLKKNQIKAAEMTFNAAQSDLLDAQDDIAVKELSLTLSQGNLQDAQKALQDAKDNLTKAQAKSPEITAPFDGFITQVNVAGGDEVLNGTIAVQIADPDKFEADVLVSEMDIPDVKVGGQALVVADALPGTFLIATVTHIAPTATITSGVVNYNVKVQVEATGANSFFKFGQSGGDSNPIPSSGPGDSKIQGSSTPSGTFRLNQGPGASGGSAIPGVSGNQSIGQLPVPTNTYVQLRQGLTVTVNIIIASRTGVLMVPNGAVTTEGSQSYVNIVQSSGEQEKRAVTTGISNWQFTEITEGLTEGEQVQVTLNLASSSLSGQRGMMFFGGR